LASIFPPSPIVGDYFTSNNTTWQWNGEAWVVLPAEGTTFKNIVTSPSTETVVADSGADTLTIIGGDYITVSASTSNDSVKISAPLIGDIIASISPSSASAAATSLHLYVKNTSGSTIYAGQAVYVTGATGADVSVGLSSNQAESTSSKTLGLAYQNIPNDSFGYIITEGNLIGSGSRPVNTSSATPGDPIWLGSTPGSKIFGLTNKPKAPNHLVYLGVVVRSHAINGVIYVKVQNGFELQELHDVRIVSASAGDIIEWNSASSIWINSPKQNIINTASAAAYTNATSYTNTQINALTTTDIEEGSNLYYTNLRVLGTASSALVHDNHTNITATYNSASNQIVLNTSGGLPAFGFDEPPIEGSEGQVYYQINSASTQILNYFQYINDEWIELGSEYNNWNYLLDGNWQYVLDEATGGWVAVLDGGGLASTASVDFNYRYIPHLVGEILFLTRQSASSTYLSFSTASTLYLSKNGGAVNGNLIIDGNFTVAGSVAYLNTEHVHIENNFITLNTGASGAYLNSGIEVYRGASPSVKIIFDENTDAWSFTNDGVNYSELGSGGGALLFQDSQPDTSELEPGTVWIDSNEDVGSGFDIASFVRWQKILSASATTISGLDDNDLSLLYTPEFENVYVNGTLLARGEDYIGSSGSAIVLTEAAVSGDIIEIHIFESFSIADAYTKTQSDAKYLSISSSTSFLLNSASSSFEPNIAYVSASPSGPTAGTLWIDSTNTAAPALKVYNGTTWIAVSGAASESGFHPFFGAYK
jgi:ribosomal protein L35AE/L33A